MFNAAKIKINKFSESLKTLVKKPTSNITNNSKLELNTEVADSTLITLTAFRNSIENIDSEDNLLSITFFDFNSLKSAIYNEDVDRVRTILKNNKHFLTQQNSKGEYPLHLALETANPDIILCVINALKEYNLDVYFQQLQVQIANGDTALHIAVDNCDAKISIVIIDDTARVNTNIFFMVNNEGYLPIHLLQERREEYLRNKNDRDNYEPSYLLDEQKQITAITYTIEKHLVNKKIIGFKEMIDLEDVLSENNELIADNEELAMNLYYGCVAINKMRSVIKESSTHPSTNSLSKKDASALTKKCHHLMEKSTKILENYDSNIVPGQESLEKNKNFLQALSDIYDQALAIGAGDCAIIGFVITYLLLKLGFNLPIQFCSLEPNGDHNFVMIGRGHSAVIVDGWSGNVYPLSKASQYLYGYTSYISFISKETNVIFPYDEKVHQITPAHYFDDVNESFFINNKRDISFFTNDEIKKFEDDRQKVVNFIDHCQLLKPSTKSSTIKI